MEGIVTLIIIIIVFNIFNFLARSIRGGRQVEQQKVPVGIDDMPPKESVRLWKDDDDVYSRSVSPGDSDIYDAGAHYDGRHGQDHGAPETEKADKNEAFKQVVRRTSRPASQEIGQHSGISSNLYQVLTQKEPLVAAFIFHEIIDPPLALRRKR